jgi:hypothetical protein
VVWSNPLAGGGYRDPDELLRSDGKRIDLRFLNVGTREVKSSVPTGGEWGEAKTACAYSSGTRGSTAKKSQAF